MSRRDFCGDDGMMTDIDVLPKPRGHQSQLGWAQKRQEVTARHPNLRLGASSAGAQYRLPACDPLELHGDSIRKHPLWKRFIEAGPAIHDLDAALQDASLVDDGSRTVAPPAAASSSPTAYHDLTRRFFGPVYCPEEQTLRSDASWNYTATGFRELPADAVRNPYHSGRFEEYPKLRRLIELKRALVDNCSAPPTYLCTDLRESTGAPPPLSQVANVGDRFHLATLVPVKYDVVLIDPPLATYEWNSVPSATNREAREIWSWDQISELPIPLLAAKESFVFLWVGPGSSDGLERGREALSRWGYRRCEVITWCLTTGESGPVTTTPGQNGAFATSAVHCLVGIRGTVRRSTDGNFVHCNVDTDVLFWPGEASGNGNTAIDLRKKPPELYSLIENFCLGTRRIELFGTNRNIRRGWLTVGHPDSLGPSGPGWDRAVDQESHPGSEATDSAERYKGTAPEAYVKDRYDARFQRDPAGCQLKDRANVVPFDELIDRLRPRSPNSTVHGDVFDPRTGGMAIDSGTRSDNLPRGLGYAGSSGRGRQPANAGPLQQHQQRLQQQMPYQMTTPSQSSLLPLPTSPGEAFASRSPTAGLGAGGPVTVSVPSGSDTLSGPQKSAIGLGLAAAQQRRGGAGGDAHPQASGGTSFASTAASPQGGRPFVRGRGGGGRGGGRGGGGGSSSRGGQRGGGVGGGEGGALSASHQQQQQRRR